MPMFNRIYVYVDGESHFIRSLHCWRALGHGDLSTLDHMQDWRGDGVHLAEGRYDAKSKFIWPSNMLRAVNGELYDGLTRKMTYFTSVSGAEPEVFRAKTLIRKAGFDPVVLTERQTLANQRSNLLQTANVIEKAKGVDIEFTTHLLEDAYNDHFDTCILFTSDRDYLPVIHAVRRKGKCVIVAGFVEGMSEHSPFYHVPEQFTNLSDWMKRLEPRPVAG